MAKSGKSSASSATRKKHARKAAFASGAVDTTVPNLPKEKKAKGKDKKGSKAEPRKKVYIPPSKPAPPRLDPLDTLGLQYTLQPELYVVLRRLGKKDAVTKTRALEELQVGWVDPVIRPPRAADSVATELATEALVQILPVWVCVFHSIIFNTVLIHY
jgi:E3 ubiquitin-protein ligase listerin